MYVCMDEWMDVLNVNGVMVVCAQEFMMYQSIRGVKKAIRISLESCSNLNRSEDVIICPLYARCSCTCNLHTRIFCQNSITSHCLSMKSSRN